MTEPELAKRLHELCGLGDRLRAPDHRHTVEAFLISRDELRNGLRRLFRDVTGAWPTAELVGAAPPRRPAPIVPAAVLRNRERQQRARARTASANSP